MCTDRDVSSSFVRFACMSRNNISARLPEFNRNPLEEDNFEVQYSFLHAQCQHLFEKCRRTKGYGELSEL
jgi:hypothetical protein